ncbi:hypothetical protein [Thermoflavimicrobium dichotomicum]|nr:hypothetical protein [Thermoflavimicrobium dichotomicum]
MSKTVIHLEGIPLNIMDLERAWFHRIQTHFFDYLHQVAEWFAYTLQTKPKYMITHEYDPPWDSSGKLIHAKQPFQLSDYPLLQEFIEEYNGCTYATFMSGCGFRHETFREDLEHLTISWLNGHLEDLIIEHYSFLPPEKLNELLTAIFDEQLFDDSLFVYSIELIEKIGIMDSKLLFELGKEKALQQIEQEKLESERKHKQEEADNQTAKMILKKLRAQYKLIYRENMPERIEKPFFNAKIKPLLIQLIQQGFSLTQIRLLSRCAIWSNSVTWELEHFSL